MRRCTIFAVFLALFTLSAAGVRAQSVSVFQTTPDLVDALSPHNPLHFSAKADAAATAPLITVDDAQRFQEIDGFGASLTDSAAWLFTTKLSPVQTDAAFKTLFSRKNGIALSFLRQPVGSPTTRFSTTSRPFCRCSRKRWPLILHSASCLPRGARPAG